MDNIDCSINVDFYYLSNETKKNWIFYIQKSYIIVIFGVLRVNPNDIWYGISLLRLGGFHFIICLIPKSFKVFKLECLSWKNKIIKIMYL